MDEEAGNLTFRCYTSDDLPFLQSSWGSSYYDGISAKRFLGPSEFHAYHRPIRDRFFQRPTATVIICSPDDDPWLIIGWIAVEKIDSGLVLQYLYVKEAFKNQGIAKQLIQRALPYRPVFYTHLTERSARIISKKYQEFQGFHHMPHLV